MVDRSQEEKRRKEVGCERSLGREEKLPLILKRLGQDAADWLDDVKVEERARKPEEPERMGDRGERRCGGLPKREGGMSVDAHMHLRARPVVVVLRGPLPCRSRTG